MVRQFFPQLVPQLIRFGDPDVALAGYQGAHLFSKALIGRLVFGGLQGLYGIRTCAHLLAERLGGGGFQVLFDVYSPLYGL